MANRNSIERLFEFDGVKYKIDSSGKVRTAGDFDENTNTIFIDKDLPEKFHEDIALHEIVERRFIKKGIATNIRTMRRKRLGLRSTGRSSALMRKRCFMKRKSLY